MPADAQSIIAEEARPPDGRPHGGRLSDILTAVAGDTARERIAISDLVDVLSHRAFGALMLVFAVPNVIPTPPGTSAILGAPLLFLATQLALNRPAPWLPRFIARRSMARADFAKLVAKLAPWLAKAERLLRPRASFLTRPPFEQAIGAICLILSIVLFLPIPGANMLPALAITVLSLAILERDGLAAIVGVVTGAVSLVIAWGVIYAVALGTLFIIRRAFGL